jgi:hypothetical protein
MAEVVKGLGLGGATIAERELIANCELRIVLIPALLILGMICHSERNEV